MEKLQEGDIIIVSTALGGEREYPVLSIEGEKAVTRFRIFNRRVYPGGNVYEFGERVGETSNGYWRKSPP